MKRKIMLELTQGEAETLLQALGYTAGRSDGPWGQMADVSVRLTAHGVKPARHRVRDDVPGAVCFYAWDGTL